MTLRKPLWVDPFAVDRGGSDAAAESRADSFFDFGADTVALGIEAEGASRAFEPHMNS